MAGAGAAETHLRPRDPPRVQRALNKMPSCGRGRLHYTLKRRPCRSPLEELVMNGSRTFAVILVILALIGLAVFAAYRYNDGGAVSGTS